jgi:hypothetical protein
MEYIGGRKNQNSFLENFTNFNSILEPRNHSTLVITILEIYTSHDLPTLKNTNLLENNP